MRKITTLLLIFSMFLSGCNKENVSSENSITNEVSSEICSTQISSSQYVDYGIDQDNFLGVGDVLVTEDCTLEDIDKRIEKMAEMGVKSHRFWLRVARAVVTDNRHCLFKIEDNEMVVNDKYYNDTTYAINKLIENGISHITLNVMWLYGKEDGNYVYYGGNYPEPGSKYYNYFINEVVYDTYYKITKLYPQVPYIEMGNEYNGNFMSFNLRQEYPVELKSQFIADFSYVATKAIKDANPNIKSVLNGVIDIEFVPTDETGKRLIECHGYDYLVNFFDVLYGQIESGNYPTTMDVKSTNPDDYFEIIAYHPYTFDNLDEWIKYNTKVYDVIIKHGDGGKPVFITEWGMEKIGDISGQTYKQIIDNKDKTPYIETIHYYIFSDAYDYSLYCLIKKDGNGDYVYTPSGEVLFNSFGTKD